MGHLSHDKGERYGLGRLVEVMALIIGIIIPTPVGTTP